MKNLSSVFSFSDWQDISPGAHLCIVYSDLEEQMSSVMPFLSQGLERGEKVVYFAHTSRKKQIKTVLRKFVPDVRQHFRSGGFTILSATDGYIENKRFDPKDMISRLAGKTAEALEEGYSGLRVTGEMEWSLQNYPGADRLLEYEKRLEGFFAEYPCTALCQYDSNCFDFPFLFNIALHHSMAIIGGKVYRARREGFSGGNNVKVNSKNDSYDEASENEGQGANDFTLKILTPRPWPSMNV